MKVGVEKVVITVKTRMKKKKSSPLPGKPVAPCETCTREVRETDGNSETRRRPNVSRKRDKKSRARLHWLTGSRGAVQRDPGPSEQVCFGDSGNGPQNRLGPTG